MYMGDQHMVRKQPEEAQKAYEKALKVLFVFYINYFNNYSSHLDHFYCLLRFRILLNLTFLQIFF